MSVDNLHMNVDFCPYEGMAVKGKCARPVTGEVIYNDGVFTGTEGREGFGKARLKRKLQRGSP